MFVSLHGRRFGFDQNGLLFDGRPVGAFTARSPRGKVFFVDSAIDATEGSSPDTAVGTLDEAFALCTASQGDVIYVMPNHAETVTGAGGITHDVAGVSVIGLGTYNQRPRFLMDAGTSVTYVISAADAHVENLVFAAGHADIVTCFNITGVGATLVNIEFVENVADENFLTMIKATGAANTADGLKIVGCRSIGIDVNAVEFLEVTDNLDGLVMTDNVVIQSGGTATPLFLCAGTKVLTNMMVLRNFLQNANTANDLAFDNGGSANTGIIAYNNIGHADVTGAHVLGAVAGARFFENRSVSTDALSGLLLPAADVDL